MAQKVLQKPNISIPKLGAVCWVMKKWIKCVASLRMVFWMLKISVLAVAATPAELLRQGVIAEETGKNSEEAIALYRKAVDTGETQRVATATALYRLGELEWRGGKTNEAIRTWRLLDAQYPDQTNLVSLIRERVPATVQSAPQGPERIAPSRSPESTTDFYRAASSVDQLEQMSSDEIPKWLTLHSVATPELTQLLARRLGLQQRLSELGSDFGPEHPEIKKAQHDMDMTKKQIGEEANEIVKILRVTLKYTRPTSAVAAEAGNPSISTTAHEEQAELINLRKILRDSPDLLTSQ